MSGSLFNRPCWNSIFAVKQKWQNKNYISSHTFMWTYCTFKNIFLKTISGVSSQGFSSVRQVAAFYFCGPWWMIGCSEAGGGTRWLKLCRCCFVAEVCATANDLALPNERIIIQKCHFLLKTLCSTYLKPLAWVDNLANPTCTLTMHRGGPELLFISAIGNDGTLIGNVGFEDIISLASWIYPSSSDSRGILKAVPGILTYSEFLRRHRATQKMI